MYGYVGECLRVCVCVPMHHIYVYIKNFVIHVQRSCFSAVYLETQKVEKPLLLYFAMMQCRVA